MCRKQSVKKNFPVLSFLLNSLVNFQQQIKPKQTKGPQACLPFSLRWEVHSRFPGTPASVALVGPGWHREQLLLTNCLDMEIVGEVKHNDKYNRKDF